MDSIVPIDVSELRNAEDEILKHVQSQCFKEERDLLEKPNQQSKGVEEIQQDFQARPDGKQRTSACGRSSTSSPN